MKTGVNRRECLGTAAAVIAATQASASVAQSSGASLSRRAHYSLKPEYRDAILQCFSKIFGMNAPMERPAQGSVGPIVAFRFPGGGAISMEFTESALSPEDLSKGAWLEIVVANPTPLQEAVKTAGYPVIHYAATANFYFESPGGQVFSIVSQPKD